MERVPHILLARQDIVRPSLRNAGIPVPVANNEPGDPSRCAVDCCDAHSASALGHTRLKRMSATAAALSESHSDPFRGRGMQGQRSAAFQTAPVLDRASPQLHLRPARHFQLAQHFQPLRALPRPQAHDLEVVEFLWTNPSVRKLPGSMPSRK
jgi:hypothetical protein